MRVAVLDIGTNAVRYLLAEKAGNEWTEVEVGGAITGLGRGLTERGELAPIAVEATLGAVGAFVRRLKAFGAQKFLVLATEAVRTAKGSEMFLERLERTAGVPVRVLSAEEEARLAFIGATSGLKLRFHADALFAVADVGGREHGNHGGQIATTRAMAQFAYRLAAAYRTVPHGRPTDFQAVASM